MQQVGSTQSQLPFFLHLYSIHFPLSSCCCRCDFLSGCRECEKKNPPNFHLKLSRLSVHVGALAQVCVVVENIQHRRKLILLNPHEIKRRKHKISSKIHPQPTELSSRNHTNTNSRTFLKFLVFKVCFLMVVATTTHENLPRRGARAREVTRKSEKCSFPHPPHPPPQWALLLAQHPTATPTASSSFNLKISSLSLVLSLLKSLISSLLFPPHHRWSVVGVSREFEYFPK